MFHWIELRTFCHATEEEARVLAAMRLILPEAEPARQALEGQFGYPLVILTARAETATLVRVLWQRVLAALGKEEVLRGLEDRLDAHGVYHLRLDKQKAYLGRIELTASADVITFRAKIAAFPNRPELVVEVLRKAAEAG